MKKKKKISLYDCSHAKVSDDIIVCEEGFFLSLASHSISIKELRRGDPLVKRICQKCEHCDQMDGGEVLPEDRGGW